MSFKNDNKEQWNSSRLSVVLKVVNYYKEINL